MYIVWLLISMSGMVLAAAQKPVIKNTNTMYEPGIIKKAVSYKRSKYEVKEAFAQQLADFKKVYGDLNKDIPAKTDSVLRVVTYNIMGEKTVRGIQTIAMFDELKKIQADVVIIQEAKLPHTLTMLKDLGYQYTTSCSGSGIYGEMVNVIASKQPFATKPVQYTFKHLAKAGVRVKHQLCFVKVTLDLKSCGIKKPLVIYGVHLEGNDEQLRFEELKDLKEMARVYDSGSNVLIAGTFNETRDMPGLTIFEHALFDDKNPSGFVTTFTKLNVQAPYFTHWSGQELDFIYLRDWYVQNGNKITDWNMPLNGSYLYYSDATGRMPVIVDLACKK
ncbi:MAG: endonuclease/exonuclease/phosphatase family protein [Candidatus Babeliales bacterium]